MRCMIDGLRKFWSWSTALNDLDIPCMVGVTKSILMGSRVPLGRSGCTFFAYCPSSLHGLCTHSESQERSEILVYMP